MLNLTLQITLTAGVTRKAKRQIPDSLWLMECIFVSEHHLLQIMYTLPFANIHEILWVIFIAIMKF